ncbi:MAG TPA: hypothetical protein VG206_13090, partial [Terriglobia bacterium]|nr:hypothetical protein [Terriglobia bacterium]
MSEQRSCVRILGRGIALLTLAIAAAPNLHAHEFQLTVSPANLEMNEVSYAAITVTVTYLNGFNGTVNLSVGCPSALSCQLVRTTFTGSGQTTLNIWS